jgi:hypothetical protein
MATLYSKCEREMECPKDVVIWNYYDHEHVVGTHYKYYSHCNIVAEQDNWCLVERKYKLPIINLVASSRGFMFLENPNLIKSIQFGAAGAVLEQEIHLKELGPEKCLVTSIYTMKVPGPFKLLQPLFERVTQKWFDDTWVEDAPMRLRRMKVWKLGFRNFSGIDWINEKRARPAESGNREYQLVLPVPKTPEAPPGSGYERPFSESVEVGYPRQ